MNAAMEPNIRARGVVFVQVNDAGSPSGAWCDMCNVDTVATPMEFWDHLDHVARLGFDRQATMRVVQAMPMANKERGAWRAGSVVFMQWSRAGGWVNT